MKKTHLYGRAFAKPVSVAAAVALAASMTPAAFAAPTSDRDVADSQVTITGLQEGDEVSAWLIADADVTANNEVSYTFASGVPGEYDSAAELSAITSDGYAFRAGSDMQNAAATIANGIVRNAVAATATASGQSATLQLGSGYYLIRVTSTSGTTKVYQNMVVDLTPQAGEGGNFKAHDAVEAAVKSTDVTVSKTVGSEYQESTDQYQVGDVVPFKIETAIPSYPADSPNATFAIGDTPSKGLKLDLDSISVKVTGATANEGVDYTIAKNDNSYVVEFKKDFILQHGGANVTVEYNAKLTKEAFSIDGGDVTGNTATVTFNPNPYQNASVEQRDIAKVQTYGYVFDKIDKNGALEGAEFTLCDADGNPIKDENGNNITSVSTNVGGKAYVYFAGLKPDVKYIAKETKVPAGHSAVNVEFTLTKDTATADNPATADITENNYLVNQAAVNDPDAPALPVTGGAGTVGMTVAGVVFIGGAAYLLMRSRRKGEE